jgi:hypothetical protein
MKYLLGLITGIAITIILLLPAFAFMQVKMSATVEESEMRKCMREKCGYQ